MGDTGKTQGFWKQIVLAVVIALVAGGTAPWWWSDLVKPYLAGAKQADDAAPVTGTYLMDNTPGRVVEITRLAGDQYRIEEPTSPWPWRGTAVLDGGRLVGQAQFRKTQARMDVEGVVRADGSIIVSYRFITDSKGNSTDRVDNHVWYPQH